MWCSAATLTRTTHGTGRYRLRSARPVGSSISPTIPSGPSLVRCSRTGADPRRPEPTRTTWCPSGALTGTAGWSSTPSCQPAHDLAQCGLRHDAELGWYVEQLALSVAGPVSSRSCSRRAAMGGHERTVDPGQQQHPVGERPIGREAAEVETGGAPWRSPRRTGTPGCGAARRSAPRVRSPRSRKEPHPRGGRCGRTARVPADEGGERPGRPGRRPPAPQPGWRRAACRPRPPWARRGRGGLAAASMLACQAGTRTGSSCSPAESPVPS